MDVLVPILITVVMAALLLDATFKLQRVKERYDEQKH